MLFEFGAEKIFEQRKVFFRASIFVFHKNVLRGELSELGEVRGNFAPCGLRVFEMNCARKRDYVPAEELGMITPPLPLFLLKIGIVCSAKEDP